MNEFKNYVTIHRYLKYQSTNEYLSQKEIEESAESSPINVTRKEIKLEINSDKFDEKCLLLPLDILFSSSEQEFIEIMGKIWKKVDAHIQPMKEHLEKMKNISKDTIKDNSNSQNISLENA